MGLTLKEQAILLAQDNKKAEPDILKIFWFADPNGSEIRLVELENNTFPALDGKIRPFYFNPSPEDGLFSRSAVALIKPEEFGQLELPGQWGSWQDAEELPLES